MTPSSLGRIGPKLNCFFSSPREVVEMAQRPDGICIVCGGPAAQNRLGPGARYCSTRCRNRRTPDVRAAKNKTKLERYAPRPPREIVCTTCGATFVFQGPGTPRFCRPCSQERARARERARLRKREEVRGLRRQMVFERDGWRCQICCRRIRRKDGRHPLSPSIDHIIPRSAGGSNALSNLRATHLKCNVSRRHEGAAQIRAPL